MNKDITAKLIALALQEDISSGDLTAKLIPKASCSKATIISRQKAIICGIDLASAIFTKLDPKIKIKWLVKDGDWVSKKQCLCKLEGPTRALLTGERTALNFLQILSGTATLTNRFVKKIQNTDVKLLDTRKTIPGMRLAQKYAVKCGGGHNHRLGLYDAILIKENHIAACGSIVQAVEQARKLYPKNTIEVEVSNFNEFNEVQSTSANIIMLDNFTLKDMRLAVKAKTSKAKLEVSGGVDLSNIAKFAKTGIDYISVGALTKTVMSIDLSMLFK
jgi:nicotinate-nucleotide pyrophosphorylase (carboxylating)